MWPHSAWAIAWSIFRGAYHVFMAYVSTFFLDYVRVPSSLLRVLESSLLRHACGPCIRTRLRPGERGRHGSKCGQQTRGT